MISNGLLSNSFLPLTNCAKMESMFMNAPSSSSSMRGTYPPSRNKSSTVTLKHGKNALTENKSHHSFVLRSSSAALRSGRRGRHRKSLHKRKEVVANMSKEKSKADGNKERIGWKDPREVKAFCDFSAAQVLDGKKHQGFLRKEGVDAVIEQLAEMGKVVTHAQYKNKWDHLKTQWKAWKECFGETGLGYDPVTGVMLQTDEWWTRKI
nr:l10-interacting myb domain-containing protein [Quercus suber]